MSKQLTIGVFDSGVGGLSVAKAIRVAFPLDKVIYANDKKHVPYGSKPPMELLGYVLPILNGLVEQKCDIIVIACNTVTTNLIDIIRTKISIPVIGIEPMVKPATKLTKTGVIAICATPATLTSSRYAELKAQYATNVSVVEPDCSDWSSMVETNEIDRQHISERIEGALAQSADVIVLGCTHYHWIEDLINEIVDSRATVIQPEQAIIRRLRQMFDLAETVQRP